MINSKVSPDFFLGSTRGLSSTLSTINLKDPMFINVGKNRNKPVAEDVIVCIK